ncbi:hypothetical protein KKG24_04625 [Patescibacteria group bacterium]|nr:hypothetical protein [Patescibacteria group bacterium]
MALPNAADICIRLETGTGEMCIVLPGGITICATLGVETGDVATIARGLIGQLNTAMAPLGPFFTVLDCIMAIFDCIKAVKDSLGPPPDPSKLVKCIPGLAQAVAKLLELHPAVSIPKTIKSALTALIAMMQGLKAELQAMILKLQMIVKAETRAAVLGNMQLLSAINCAHDQLDFQLINLNESLSPISRLIGVINVLMKLAGQDCIQIPLNAITAVSNEMLAPIDIAIEFLTMIRGFIPVPELLLPPIPLSTDPC